MTETKKDFPKIERKAVVEETPEVEVEPVVELTFTEKMLALGQLIRAKAPEILKFDSMVENISYTYVDTHQYKRLLALICDELNLGFGLSTTNQTLTIEHDKSGTKDILIYIVQVEYLIEFYDTTGNKQYTASGLGISRGSGYASSIAGTNALRNFILDNFLLPGSDREDDVQQNFKPAKYLSESQKSEKREELLEKTKSTAEYATIQYGTIIRTKIDETLKKDIPDDFRKTLENFVANKYDNEGNPLPLDGDSNIWVVKKKAAGAILTDLDQYAN